MNQPRQRLWVVAYDIRDNKTRRRVNKLLKNCGQSVQFSVFECWLDKMGMQELRNSILQELNDEDVVRWYPLCWWCAQSVERQGIGQEPDNSGYYLL